MSTGENTALALVAALRQEGDAWDVAGSHYLANLLHGAADEIERSSHALREVRRLCNATPADPPWLLPNLIAEEVRKALP